ncbi:MAG: hypothetical protein JNG84_13955 [Archangium sp.]|nr:hypothetical protein [Archangium sp.]
MIPITVWNRFSTRRFIFFRTGDDVMVPEAFTSEQAPRHLSAEDLDEVVNELDDDGANEALALVAQDVALAPAELRDAREALREWLLSGQVQVRWNEIEHSFGWGPRAEEAPVEDDAPAEELSDIEIKVEDEEGNPWKGEYELTPPGANPIKGKVSDGVIYVDKLSRGNCTLTLLGLDGSQWGPNSVPTALGTPLKEEVKEVDPEALEPADETSESAAGTPGMPSGKLMKTALKVAPLVGMAADLKKKGPEQFAKDMALDTALEFADKKLDKLLENAKDPRLKNLNIDVAKVYTLAKKTKEEGIEGLAKGIIVMKVSEMAGAVMGDMMEKLSVNAMLGGKLKLGLGLMLASSKIEKITARVVENALDHAMEPPEHEAEYEAAAHEDLPPPSDGITPVFVYDPAIAQQLKAQYHAETDPAVREELRLRHADVLATRDFDGMTNDELDAEYTRVKKQVDLGLVPRSRLDAIDTAQLMYSVQEGPPPPKDPETPEQAEARIEKKNEELVALAGDAGASPEEQAALAAKYDAMGQKQLAVVPS